MFSLIITIISIALVAALALATLYYGGQAFNKGSAEAEATKAINEAQQVAGAIQLFRADLASGMLVIPDQKDRENLGDVITAGYLKQLPASFEGKEFILIDPTSTSGVYHGQIFTGTLSGSEVCDAINKKAGITAAMTADPNDVDGKLHTTSTEIDKMQFGCISDDGVFSLRYKF